MIFFILVNTSTLEAKSRFLLFHVRKSSESSQINRDLLHQTE